MICPENLATVVTALAIAMAQDKSVAELNVLSSIFNQLGETLETIMSQREYLESNCNKNNWA